MVHATLKRRFRNEPNLCLQALPTLLILLLSGPSSWSACVRLAKTLPALLIPLLVGLALAGCTTEQVQDSGAAAGSDSSASADQAPFDTSRIVVMGGPATEIVYALGLGDRVVGTDRSSLYPLDVLEKPRLNFYRNTSAESILSLEPTLVVAVDGLGPLGVAEQIRTAHVPVLMVPEATTLERAEQRVEMLGQALGRPEEAHAILSQMREELDAVASLRPAHPPRALFVYARGAGLVNVSGKNTQADLVLRLAGAENVFTSFDGFRPLTAEAAVAAAPEVIVIPEAGMESLGGVDGLLQQPGLAQTPAGQERRLITVDDNLLLGLGPRIGQGVAHLARALDDVP